MKQPAIVRETINLSPELPPCDLFCPRDEGLVRDRGDARFLVVPGLGSIREDYASFATAIAAQGFRVYSPNCNDGLKGSEKGDVLSQRVEVIHDTISILGEPVHTTPHSIGAPVTAIALGAGAESGLNDIARNIESISFMQPAGFEVHGSDDFIHAWRFFMGEAALRTIKLVPVVLRGGKSSRERFNISKRAGEVSGLWNLGKDYMPTAVSILHDNGVPMKFFVGPRDSLTRAESIRQAVDETLGEGHVVDIHPNAGHISAVTHPKRTAHLILENLGIEQIDYARPKSVA